MVSWAHLNDEGKAQFGDIFPDAKVPIISILPTRAILAVREGDGTDEQNVYLVNVKELKPETIDHLVNKIATKFNAPPEKVRKSIVETDGMVLRTSLTSGAGTDNIAPFLDDEEFEEDEDEEVDDLEGENEEDQFP